MKRTIPTTQSLMAFALTARHLSFTRAGFELCLTPGAVSRQVASLEEFVRAPLFLRLNPGLQLTAVGQRYLPTVESILRELEVATLGLRGPDGGQRAQVSISCHPTLASTWLIPKLPAFSAHFEGVTLNLLPPVWGQPLGSDVDLAIRFGDGIWPDIDAQYLTGRHFVAVASPSAFALMGFAEGSTLTDRLVGLSSEVLLHHAQVPDAWSIALAQWCSECQFELTISPNAGPRFGQFSALMQAAAMGYGVAIVPEIIARHELESGRLIQVIDEHACIRGGYFVCTPNGRRNNLLIQQVVGFLLRMAETESDRELN